MRTRRWCGVAGSAMMLAAISLIFVVPTAKAQSDPARRIVRIEAGGPFLGIEMEDVTADNVATHKLSAERGVIVRSVEKDSPAEAAGLQKNDVILEYSAMPVISSAQFARVVRETPIGRKVDLVVSRDGKRMNLSARIAKRDAGSGGDGEQVEVLPRPDFGRQFEFRMPGRNGFNFQMPDDAFGYNGAPDGDRTFYLNDNERPRLGVNLQPLTGQLAEFLGVPGKKGALVTAVTDGSPAAGKLRAGDVIIRAENKSISDPGDLVRAVSAREGKLDLVLIREKKEISVSVELPKTESRPGKGGYRL